MEVQQVIDEDNSPRRSPRLALSELNDSVGSPNGTSSTPTKNTNPDEMIIVQRGRRRKPITWSPVDYDKTVVLAPPKDQVGSEAPKKCEINPRLRRRLVMSPTKTNPSEALGLLIAKKLRVLKGLEDA